MAEKKYPGKMIPGAGNRIVPITELTLNPDNLRTYAAYRESMDALKASIKANGIINPLQIYPDGVIHAGNTRFLVVQELLAEGVTHDDKGGDLSNLPANIVQRESDRATAVINQLEGNRGEKFDALDQATAFSVLREEGLSYSDIARRTGFTSVWVSSMMTLHDAGDEEVFTAIRTGRMSATLAAEVLRKHSDITILTEALEAAMQAGAGKATQRHVDAILTARAEANAPAEPPVPTPAPEADTSPSDAKKGKKADDAPWSPNDIEPEPDSDVSKAEVDAEEELDPYAPGEVESGTDATVEAEAEAEAEVEADVTPGNAEAENDAAPAAAPDLPVKVTLSLVKSELVLLTPVLEDIINAAETGTAEEKLEVLADNVEFLREFLVTIKNFGVTAE